MAASEAPEQLPAVLNNFGIACTFLPEPDEAGIPAMKSALLMKRMAGMSIGGTLQNLTNLLMRFGHFSEALPLATEQEVVARQKGDHRLELDARAKVSALRQVLRIDGAAQPVPPTWETEGADVHQQSMDRLVKEGRIRSALRRRWPLLRDMLEADRGMQAETAVRITGTAFLATKAQTILFLLRGEVGLPAVESPLASEGDENFILELVDEPPIGQAAFLRGSLFAVDSGTGKWVPAPHADACECGRPEVHSNLRELAEALVAVYRQTREKPYLRSTWKKKYPAVFVEEAPHDDGGSAQRERDNRTVAGNRAGT
jgi:hypothetical protein